MRVNEIEIMHGGKAVVLRPEVYDPLRPDTATGKASIDIRHSEGVVVNNDGFVEDAPVVDVDDIAGEIETADSLPRPSLPPVDWALVRTAISPYQMTALNLPTVKLTADVPDTSGSARKLSEDSLRILEEYRETCRRNGAFCSPFFVVAALRMNDGSHTLASAPVLMQPVSAAPLLRVDNSVATEGQLQLEVSIINTPCRLLMKVEKASVDELTAQFATHLDIFVSEAAPWLTSAGGEHAAVFRTAADIFTHSGLSADYGSLNRPQQLMGKDDTVPCLYYPRCDREDIGEWMCGVNGFYKAGELPLDSISGDWTEAVCGEIPVAEPAESFSPDYTLHTEVADGRVERLNGLMCVAAPCLRLPHTGTLRSLAQYDDRNNAADAVVGSVTVSGSKNGVPVERRCEAQEGRDSLWQIGSEVVEDLVWIFYPDPDMCRLTIHTGDRELTLKLRRHRKLSGAYWCGLLRGADRDKHSLPPATLDPDSRPQSVYGCPAVYGCPGTMLTALEACEGLFPASRQLSFPAPGRLIGVAPALRSMSSGELGRFPLYAFTDTAVWAVSPTDSGGWRQVQPIALTACDGRETITPTHTAVAFAAYGSVWLAEGSKVRRILPVGTLGGEIVAIGFDAHHNRLMIGLTDGRVVLYCMERGVLTGVAARSDDSPRRFVTLPVRLPAEGCVTSVCCHGSGIGYTRLWTGTGPAGYVGGAPGHSLRHFSTPPVSLLRIGMESAEA